MPIYEYRCSQCGHVFEKLIRSFNSAGQIECPECHSTDCVKQMSSFGGSWGTGSSGCAPSGG